MKSCPACGYALGGEIPDPGLGPKRERDMPAIDDPEMQLDVCRGENAKAKKAETEEKAKAELAEALRRRRARRL